MLHETATSFTFLDFAMIGIVALSGIFGFFRGFTREVLTIGGWVLATLVTFYGMGWVKPWGRSFMPGQSFAADVITILGLFIVSSIIFSMIIRFLSDKVKASMLGSLDRSLGMVFGATRGLLILMALFALTVYIFPKPETRPSIVQQARLVPSLSWATGWLISLLPESFIDAKYLKAFQGGKEASAEEITQSLAKPQAGTFRKSGRHGYSANDRQEIENMFAEG